MEDGKNAKIYNVGKIMPCQFFLGFIEKKIEYHTSPWISEIAQKSAFADSMFPIKLKKL